MTDFDSETRFKTSDRVLSTTVGDETVFLHLGNESYYGLNDVGGLVWEKLQGGATFSEAVDAVCEQFDVERDTAEADIRALIADLLDQEFLSLA